MKKATKRTWKTNSGVIGTGKMVEHSFQLKIFLILNIWNGLCSLPLALHHDTQFLRSFMTAINFWVMSNCMQEITMVRNLFISLPSIVSQRFYRCIWDCNPPYSRGSFCIKHRSFFSIKDIRSFFFTFNSLMWIFNFFVIHSSTLNLSCLMPLIKFSVQPTSCQTCLLPELSRNYFSGREKDMAMWSASGIPTAE